MGNGHVMKRVALMQASAAGDIGLEIGMTDIARKVIHR